MKTYQFTNKGFSDAPFCLKVGNLYSVRSSSIPKYLEVYTLDGDFLGNFHPARFEEATAAEPLFASSYGDYQELVWSVIERALKDGFFEALKDVRNYGISTRTEILSIADVTPSTYERDCMKAYIRELDTRRILDNAELQKLREHARLTMTSGQEAVAALVSCQDCQGKGHRLMGDVSAWAEKCDTCASSGLVTEGEPGSETYTEEVHD